MHPDSTPPISTELLVGAIRSHLITGGEETAVPLLERIHQRLMDAEARTDRLQQYAYLLETREHDGEADLAPLRREAGIIVGDTIGHDGFPERRDWWSR